MTVLCASEEDASIIMSLSSDDDEGATGASDAGICE